MDEVYLHWTKRAVYTQGVKHIAEVAGAYWLIDAILSHQVYPLAKREEFQVWRLVVDLEKHSAMLTMTNGHTDRPIIEQFIEWTDFPESECELYLVRTPGQKPELCLLQPCEY
jgi:hypothetical protein